MTNPKPKSEWEPRSPFAMTDAEIAEQMGISRQRVSQIAIEAMEKIRREFERRGIRAGDFYDVEAP